MILIELLDRLLQFLAKEFLEVFINKISNILTKIVVYLCNIFKNRKTDISFPQVVLLQRSENFLVINKPPDLLINSNDVKKTSVQTILRKEFPELMNSDLKHEFYFAHRLDYSTSGILCLPLNKTACSALCGALEARKCSKYYIALLNGHISQQLVSIDNPVGDDIRYQTTSKKMCTTNELEFCKNPRESRTILCVTATGYYLDRPCTKVLLKPITGRRHQLRVHCSSIGHPILGDYTYGSEMDKNLPRMFLHAIRLIAPNEIESISIETADPFDENILKWWRPEKNGGDAVKYSNDLSYFYNLLESTC